MVGGDFFLLNDEGSDTGHIALIVDGAFQPRANFKTDLLHIKNNCRRRSCRSHLELEILEH